MKRGSMRPRPRPLDTAEKLWTYGFICILEFAAAAETIGVPEEQWRPAVIAVTIGLEARARELGEHG